MSLMGLSDWSVPADWREITPKFDAAVQIIRYCVEDDARYDGMTIAQLGDAIAAVDYVRNIPSQFHTDQHKAVVMAGRKISLQRTSIRPKIGVMGLVNLVASPGAAVAGIAAGVGLRVLGSQAMTNKQSFENVLSEVQLCAVDVQLEKVLRSSEIPRDASVDRLIGQRVYWLGFVYPKEWSWIPTTYEFTAAEANRAIEKSAVDVDSKRHNMAVLIDSPYCPSMSDMDSIARKLKKGKNVPEMEMAWNWYRKVVATRQRHVMPFAQRMGWTS